MAEHSVHPNPDMLALGIRQPWAELILRGIKSIEVRSRNTKVRGPIYIYASRKLSNQPEAIQAAEQNEIKIETLPLGLVVGTVEIKSSGLANPKDALQTCLPAEQIVGKYSWQLSSPIQFEEPLTVRFLPYGVWFYPWRRRNSSRSN